MYPSADRPPSVIFPSADRPLLERRSYSSPLSFTGSASRIISGCARIRNRNWSRAALVTAILIVIPVIWAIVSAWYVLVFGLFGIFAIPWRLHRRSQRRAQHLAEAQLSAIQRWTSQ